MTLAFLNVASHLARLAKLEPERAAIHVPCRRVNSEVDTPDDYVSLTFRELHEASDAIAHGLVSAGIGRGTRTAMMVPPGLDFFTLTFAMFKVGAVPVLVDPGMGIKNLGTCLAEAEPEAFIGIPRAHFARRVLGWAKRTVRITVNVGRARFFCQHSLHRLRDNSLSLGPFAGPEVAAEDTAAILFTSGSTGIAKGVVYTHGIFAAQVEMLKATYGIEPGEVDLCTFPLFALFGPALGMTCVVPDMDPTRPAKIDPRKVVKQIRQFGATNLFGSPAVVHRLGEYGVESGVKLPTLRRVISAGAPVPARAIEALAKMLPETTQVYTPYGATEALPVANIGSLEILGETRSLTDQGRGVCVGKPVEGMQVSVIPITDSVVPEWDESTCLLPGQIGEFVVRGPVVTKRYHNRPEQTRLAKIRDAATGETLHRMGDVGYLDEQGRMWFCGRKSHRVETPSGTLFTEMVEGVFNTVPGVFRTALVSVVRAGTTHPVVCVELEPPPIGIRGRREWLSMVSSLREQAKRSEVTLGLEIFLCHDGFPVDVRHNAKIFRERLAVWADRTLGPAWNPVPDAQALQRVDLSEKTQ